MCIVGQVAHRGPDEQENIDANESLARGWTSPTATEGTAIAEHFRGRAAQAIDERLSAKKGLPALRPLSKLGGLEDVFGRASARKKR